MGTTYDVEIAREFDAPVDRVWRAWTHPDDLLEWWGPTGFSCTRAEADIRVGGRIAVTMRAPEEWGGFEQHSTWTISEFEPEHRLRYVFNFTNAEWARITPAEAGIPDGVPTDGAHEILLTALGDGRTRLEMTEHGYLTEAARDLSLSGLEQCLDKMAVLVENRS